MRSLGEFPPEILESILQQLQATDLSTICRVNKGLHMLCEPLLYANLEWTWDDERQHPPILDFLDRLIKRPDLASRVRSVIVHGQNWHKREADNPLVDVPEESYGPLAAAINKVDNLSFHGKRINLHHYDSIDELRDGWKNKVRQGSVDALLALLLSQLPNLAELHLGENASRWTDFIGCVLRSALFSPDAGLPRLKSLTRVAITPHLYDEYLDYRDNLQDLTPLFYLANIRRMTLAIDTWGEFKWIDTLPEPELPNLTFLDLKSTFDKHLSRLLAATRSLTVLRYTSWRYLDDYEIARNSSLVDMSDINSALALPQISQSVVDLSITVDYPRSNSDFLEPRLTNGSLKALRSFSKLKTLEISPAFVVGYGPPEEHAPWPMEGTIPGTVESVTFRGGFPHLVHRYWRPREFMLQVHAWALQRQYAPSLRCLRLGDVEGEWEGDIPEWSLRAVCDRFKVEFEVYDVP